MRRILVPVAVASIGLGLVGCSESDSSDGAAAEAATTEATTTEQATSAPEPTAPTSAVVTMGAPTEFAMVPEVPEVAAGRVTLDVVNDGSIEHEVVLIGTDRDSGDLPTDANGAALEDGAVVPHGGDHEQAEADHHAGVHFATGTRGKVTVDLKPGNYAVVCNLPGHYEAGMHANLKVI